jgi:hypothetical protein
MTNRFYYPLAEEFHYNNTFGVVNHCLTELAKAHNHDLFGVHLQRKDGQEGHLLLEVKSFDKEIILQVLNSQFTPICAHATWFIPLSSLQNSDISVDGDNIVLDYWCKELHRALRWAIAKEKAYIDTLAASPLPQEMETSI